MCWRLDLRPLWSLAATLLGALAVVGLLWAVETSHESSLKATAGVQCTDGPCRMALVGTVDDPAAGSCDAIKCTIEAGEKVKVAVVMESVPSDGYTLAQSWIAYGSDLLYGAKGEPGNYSYPNLDLAEEILWPDCETVVLVRGPETAVNVNHACTTSLLPPHPVSYHDGPFIEVSFLCSPDNSSTTIRLLPSGDPVAGTSGALYKSASDGSDVVPEVDELTINCVGGSPVPTVPTFPSADTPTETPASGTPGQSTTPTVTPTDNPPTATPTATWTQVPTWTPAPTWTPMPTWTPEGLETPTATVRSATPTDTPASTLIPTSTPTRRPTLVGDVNCDTSVDPIDAVFLMYLEAVVIDELPCPDAGDANGDGETSLIDATVILQFTARLISSLPP